MDAVESQSKFNLRHHKPWHRITVAFTFSLCFLSSQIASYGEPSHQDDPIKLPGVHEGSLKSDVYKLLRKDFVDGLEVSPSQIDDVVHKILWKTSVPIAGHVLLNPPGPDSTADDVLLYEFGKQIEQSRSIDLDKLLELKQCYLDQEKSDLAYQVTLLEALIYVRLPNREDENKKLLAEFEKFRHKQMQSKLAEAEKFLKEKEYRRTSNSIVECFDMARDGQSLLPFSQTYPDGVIRFDISSFKLRRGPMTDGADAFVTCLIASRSDVERAYKLAKEANPHLGEWPCSWTPILKKLAQSN